MKAYSAFRHPQLPLEKTVFVKEGFSWPAFLVPVIWLIVKRLWLSLAVYILALVALYAAARAGELGASSLAMMTFALNLILGFEANLMYRRALMRRGFTEEVPVFAADIEEAALKYFHAHASTSSAPSASDALDQFSAMPRSGSS
ncbi:MAG TPA: DUF2628 domain-containing protein [Aestuariivirgaceae bacterium]|jgi:hypothetical protein